MRFQDAELMRLRAHTLAEPDSRRAALESAADHARRQDALLFELRCALDSFELLDDGDRSHLADLMSRLPSGAQWPEYARAERILY